jgi:hypothetical protein
MEYLNQICLMSSPGLNIGFYFCYARLTFIDGVLFNIVIIVFATR